MSVRRVLGLTGWAFLVDGLVTAAELARLLGVSRAYVYEHADELGAERIGDGPKARLRFDVARARAAFGRKQAKPEPQRRMPRVRRAPAPLLPVKERVACDRLTRDLHSTDQKNGAAPRTRPAPGTTIGGRDAEAA